MSEVKEIKVGEVNDLYLWATEDTQYFEGEKDTRYCPMSKIDHLYQSADAKIYYDSGIYPGITPEELPQYICNKATHQVFG